MKKLTAEKCREQFEVWGESRRCELGKWVRGDRKGEYKNPVVEKMWQAWQASRDALPILEQQERGEWIEWKGGECPVDKKQVVHLKFRDGEVDDDGNKAFIMRWSHIGTDWDIIAYRIIPEQPTNQNGEQ